MDASAVRHLRRDLQSLALDLGGTNRMRQPLLRIAREVLAPSINQNFEVGGRPTAWRATASGMRYRSARGGGSGPLVVTGKLKRSASALARFKVRKNVMTYGNFPNRSWYAAVHDSDEISQKANIPSRPFALIQQEDEAAIGRIFMDWVESRVNAHLRRVYLS